MSHEATPKESWPGTERRQATQEPDLRRLHEALALSNLKYKNLFELAPVAYLFLSPAGQVQEANVAATRLFGQPAALLNGCHVQVFIRNEDRLSLQQHLERVAEGQLDVLEVRVLQSDGRQLPVSIRSTAMLDATGAVAGLHMALMDVSAHKDAESELRQARDHLQHLAHHDPLTDLPNRLLFGDRLRQALIRAQRRKGCVGLLFIDVDRFKFINDSLGHQAGDQFLCAIAHRVRDSVRAVDTVARIGGDEFTVILERIEHAGHAQEVAQKIQQALREPLDLGRPAHRVQVTSSIGIAVYPEHGADTDELIRHADAAMFAAKEQGRDRVQVFDHALDARISDRVRIESELREATHRDELRIHYQPQFDRAGRTIVGVEALLRWQHPVRGLLSAAQFMDVVEESGLIQPLGAWVLREACQQGRRWHDRGHCVRIAVNVSTRQLGLRSFVDELDKALHDSSFPPEALELEVTERALMIDAEGVFETLRAIRVLGVHVAIDDFGTGFSSLSRLRRLPISKLKIDRSLVQRIPHSADDRAVALAIISMAHDLGLRVTSEGVETPEQRAFLEAGGSDMLQGDWLGHALPAEDIDALLATS